MGCHDSIAVHLPVCRDRAVRRPQRLLGRASYGSHSGISTSLGALRVQCTFIPASIGPLPTAVPPFDVLGPFAYSTGVQQTGDAIAQWHGR